MGDRVYQNGAAKLETKYKDLYASTKGAARSIYANVYRSRMELQAWVIVVESVAREARQIAMEIEALAHSARTWWDGEAADSDSNPGDEEEDEEEEE